MNWRCHLMLWTSIFFQAISSRINEGISESNHEFNDALGNAQEQNTANLNSIQQKILVERIFREMGGNGLAFQKKCVTFEHGFVTRINWSNRKLNGAIPKSIGKLATLKSLYVLHDINLKGAR